MCCVMLHSSSRAAPHLDDSILAVNLTLVVLAQHLDLLAQLLHLRHAHNLAPLVVYLDTIDMCILLFAQLTIAQRHTREFLQVQGHHLDISGVAFVIRHLYLCVSHQKYNKGSL
jgi:hypothetical protein